MPRCTTLLEGGKYAIDRASLTDTAAGYTGRAAEKLARFENLRDDLTAEQARLAAELEALRAAGKTNSYKFKEKMGQKLTNSAILARLNICALAP